MAYSLPFPINMDAVTPHNSRPGVLLYYPEKSGRGPELERLLSRELEEERLEVRRTMSGLISTLRNPRRLKEPAVFVIAGRKELARLLSLKSLLNGVRLILILPDRTEETVALAHRLHPRFLSYLDSEFAPVIMVVRRLMDTSRKAKARPAQREKEP